MSNKISLRIKNAGKKISGLFDFTFSSKWAREAPMDAPIFRIQKMGIEDKFCLRTSKSYWHWIFIGGTITTSPLLPWYPAKICIGWLAIIILLIIQFRYRALRKSSELLRRIPSIYVRSPYPRRIDELVFWRQLWIITSIVNFSSAFYSPPGINALADTTILQSHYLSALVLCTTFALLLFALEKWSIQQQGTLCISSFNKWMSELPKPLKENINAVIDKKCQYPTSQWRHLNDSSREALSTAMASAFFESAESNKRHWKSRITWILWLSGPIAIPLVALCIMPFLMTAINSNGIYRPILALCIVAWCSWSTAWLNQISKYIAFDNKTGESNINSKTALSAFSHHNIKFRKAVAKYYNGQGGQIFQIFSLSVVPLYITLLGIFTDPVEPSYTTINMLIDSAADFIASFCMLTISIVEHSGLSLQ